MGYILSPFIRNYRLHNMKKHIILILFFITFFLPGCNQNSSPVFQEEIGGLKLVQLLADKDAMYAINKLHGKKINVASGMVAFYQGKGEKATIWVSESFNTDDAKQQTKIMIDKMIASKRSPFSNYEEIRQDGVKIYSFKGMGQKHYIFRISKSIYWITANPGTIDKLLDFLII